MKPSNHPMFVAAAGVLAFAFGLVASVSVKSVFFREVSLQQGGSATGFSSLEQIPSSGQVVLAYFGSSGCPWCNRDELVGQVRSAIGLVAVWSEQRDLRYTTVGVAIDSSPDDGMEHLGRVHEFDQVSSGGGWSNELAQGSFGVTAVPQIVVVVKNLDTGAESAVRSAPLVLARKIGTFEIDDWVRAGAPMPHVAGKREPRKAVIGESPKW